MDSDEERDFFAELSSKFPDSGEVSGVELQKYTSVTSQRFVLASEGFVLACGASVVGLGRSQFSCWFLPSSTTVLSGWTPLIS